MGAPDSGLLPPSAPMSRPDTSGVAPRIRPASSGGAPRLRPASSVGSSRAGLPPPAGRPDSGMLLAPAPPAVLLPRPPDLLAASPWSRLDAHPAFYRAAARPEGRCRRSPELPRRRPAVGSSPLCSRPPAQVPSSRPANPCEGADPFTVLLGI